MKKIVIGVSAYAGDNPAIAWTEELARSQALAITLVHIVETTWGHPPIDLIEREILAATAGLRERASLVQGELDGVEVTSLVRLGSATNELVVAAEDADLLVIGAHPEDHPHLSQGRVSRLATLAHCSVVIVPSAASPVGSGVVVGVDGSVESDLAVEFAAELADRYQEPLTVILAWGQPEAWGFVEPLLFEVHPAQSDLLIVAESIAGLASRYPDLVVRTEVSAARAEYALLQAGQGSRMVVLGSRGSHGLARALLGSVTESVVAGLPCAVAVIRAKVAVE